MPPGFRARRRARPSACTTCSASASGRRTSRSRSRIDEHNAGAGSRSAELDALFLEKQDRFGWHRGMLLDDATMQVSFLKDLVTMRNPTSAYSFVAYLHECGRLVDFMNHKTLFPLRIEFHDYLEWAARQMSHLVDYGAEVVDVQPVRDEDGVVDAFDVAIRDRAGDSEPVRASRAQPRHRRRPGAAHAPGHRALRARLAQPRLPAPRRGARRRAAPPRASSSSAPARARRRSRATCTASSREPRSARYSRATATRRPTTARSPTGSSTPRPSTPTIDAPPAVKQMLLDYHRNTNYSVVDAELIEDLYRRAYQEKVTGRERLRILHTSPRARRARRRPDGRVVRARSKCLSTGERARALEADAVVFATGYRPVCPLGLLGGAHALCATSDDGMVCVGRDYRVDTSCAMRAGHLPAGRDRAHARHRLDAAVEHGRPRGRDPRLDPRSRCTRRHRQPPPGDGGTARLKLPGAARPVARLARGCDARRR